MRLFIDGEWNGYRGELISMALVAEDGREFYAVLGCANPEPWVAENVMPKLAGTRESIDSAQVRLSLFLAQFDAAHIVADWPEDIERFCRLLITGPGTRIDTPPLTMEIVRVDAPSKNPHNALADARGLRDSLAIARAADYLRAQADAKPVAHCAMLDSHRRVVERAIEDAARPSGMSTHDGKARIDASILRRMLAIIDSLPAAPQAEPSAALIRAYNSGYMQGHHDTVESCFTDIHQSDMDTFHADLVAELGLSAAPQAEPKREPSEKQIADACYRYRHDFGLLDKYEQDCVVNEARRWADAFGIGGSDE